MKVERKEEFTPVTITIESQDELNYLWHCLVLPKYKVKAFHKVNLDLPDLPDFPDDLDSDDMFDALHKIINE